MKKQILFRPLVLAILAFGLGQTSFAQKAGIHGRITDSTKAVLVGAEVLVTTVDTGIKRKAVSSEEGYYAVDLLQRGEYQISVQMQGFKPVVRSGIALDVHQVARIDFTMEVGELTQKIEVDANASPLNFENAEIKHAVPMRALEDLPLQLAGGPRNAVRFALLVPGVSTGGNNDAFNTRINGGQQLGDEALIDGVSMQQGVTGDGILPLLGGGLNPEQVSEVGVLTSNYEPQYGSTSAGVITMVTRSGTKEFHGEAHEFHRNTVLNARQFGVDTRPLNIENEFGASIGGPVKIPLLWGGQRKTFFHISYNGWVPRGGTVARFLSFPTLQQRQGDFRDWVDARGNLIPIYDPDTTRPNPALNRNLPLSPTNEPFLRNQFMGCNGQTPNVICPSDPRLQNSLAKKWFQFLPPPNRPGLTDNFVAPAQPGFGVNYQNSWALRLDHHLSEKDHFALALRYNEEVRKVDTSYPPQLSPQKLTAGTGIWAPRLNWDHIFSPTLVNNINFGYKNSKGSEACVSQPFANLFPKIPGVDPNATGSPVLAFEDFSRLGCTGGISGSSRTAYIVNDLLTWVRGKHTLKFGGEYRALGGGVVRQPNLGQFGFTRLNTGLIGTTPSGSAIASFLLEQVDNGGAIYRSNSTVAERAKYYTAHAGDTWKATSKLTLNFGLRWDLSLPVVEKFNRTSFLDPLGANPGAGGRPGRLAFAGTGYGAASFGRDHPEVTWYKAFAPRVGLAYRVNDKTVVRTGYGIFYSVPVYQGWSGGNSQEGFNLALGYSSPDGGLTRSFILREGIPQTFTPPPFIDSTYLNGQSGPLYRPFNANRLPYSQQWNLTIERELTKDFYLSAAYVGNKGTRLISTTAPINALDPKLLSMGEALFARFQPGQTQLNGVAVPYPGWIEQMRACAPTVAQALLPFPQYCGRLQGINENAGNSTYHSFQFKAEKRMARGTWLLASYTLSKLLTDSDNIFQSRGGFSPFERHRNKSLAPDDVPQTLSLAFVYELPFGSGKRFLSQAGPVNKLLGGWQVSSVFKASTGVPFVFSSGACRLPQEQFAASCIPAVLPGADPFLQDPDNFDPGKGRLFDLAAFEGPTFNFAFGHGSRVSNLRAQGFHNQDVTLMKNTYITERVSIQFRAEFFNIWNWHMFSAGGFGGGVGAFNTNVASQNFGQWNGSVTPPRNIQFGLKVVF